MFSLLSLFCLFGLDWPFECKHEIAGLLHAGHALLRDHALSLRRVLGLVACAPRRRQPPLLAAIEHGVDRVLHHARQTTARKNFKMISALLFLFFSFFFFFLFLGLVEPRENERGFQILRGPGKTGVLAPETLMPRQPLPAGDILGEPDQKKKTKSMAAPCFVPSPSLTAAACGSAETGDQTRRRAKGPGRWPGCPCTRETRPCWTRLHGH